MKTIENDIIVPFDVDGTLLDYNIEGVPESELIDIGMNPEFVIKVRPLKEHVQRVKNHKASNHFIIVWSGSGHGWAEHVVKTLGLEKYVDLVISKPRWCYDDVPSEEWMKRLFLPDKKCRA